MTKEEAIQQVENAFDAFESEWKVLGDDWSYEHEARDMAIEALKRDDPKTEFQKRFEKSTFCGYSAKELLMFADACRRSNINEVDLHEFCTNVESAWKYIIEKTHEEIEKEIERQISTWGSFSA
jgi:predicted transcriptional regulator